MKKNVYEKIMELIDAVFGNDPAENTDAPAAAIAEGATTASPSTALRSAQGEVEFIESGVGMYMPLMEKAVRRDGTIPIKIIAPGWGSSGYYPAEVLERDGPKIFTKGTKMYWNHQTMQEEAERPEGDLRNLAAELATDARWQANGAAGAGLYADAKVFEGYKSAVDDLAGHIGVSIRAYGKAQRGMAEGREGAIVMQLNDKKSIDFVTAPGAGGQILSLFEAARTPPLAPPRLGTNGEGNETGRVVEKKSTTVSVESDHHEENKNMNEEQIKALVESHAAQQKQIDAVVTENARMKEALAFREARDVVATALNKRALPDATRARLLESLQKKAPMKEGALDVAAFETLITEAIKAESDYLATVLGAGNIRGMGESAHEDEEQDDAKVKDELEEAFAGIGLSEAGAKIAARGRG